MGDIPENQTPVDEVQPTPPVEPETPAPVEPEPAPQGDPAPVDQDDLPEGADALGDPGKRALDAMKEQRNAARDQVRDLTAQLEQVQQAGTATQERLQSLSQQVIKANVLAAAKGQLANPEDAFAFLDLDSFDVGEDGGVDSSTIEQAISGLLEQRPYLAGEAPRFQGSAGGGGGTSDPAQQQVTREELSRMAPEEVLKAKQQGRLDQLLKG